jgi:hypothetical protein
MHQWLILSHRLCLFNIIRPYSHCVSSNSWSTTSYIDTSIFIDFLMRLCFSRRLYPTWSTCMTFVNTVLRAIIADRNSLACCNCIVRYGIDNNLTTCIIMMNSKLIVWWDEKRWMFFSSMKMNSMMIDTTGEQQTATADGIAIVCAWLSSLLNSRYNSRRG